MTAALRVAQRYALARHLHAGIFEAPPAMLESVGAWISSVYAGHVLAAVEKRIDNMRDRLGVIDQQIDQMRNSLASCEQDIRKLKPEQSVRYTMWIDPIKGFGVVGVRREKCTYWNTEDGVRTTFCYDNKNPDPKKYLPLYEYGTGIKKLDFIYSRETLTWDVIAQKIKEALSASIERLEKFKSKQTPKAINGPKLVEAILIQRECLKYTSGTKAYAAKAARKFPIDLSGWKYIRPGAPIIKEVNDKIAEKNAEIRKQIDVAHQTFALATEAFKLAKGNRDWENDPKIDAILDKLDSREWLDEWPNEPVWNQSKTRGAIYTKKRPDQPLVWVRTTHGATPAPIPELEKTIEPLLGPNDVIQALGHGDLGTWKEILVQLDFIGHKDSLGTWKTYQRTLTVDIRGETPTTVADFQETLDDILRTTRHELQHMGQDILTTIQGLKQEAGTPSQDIRVPSQEPGKKPERKEHALREEEFYTRLADEIDKFVAAARKRPEGLRGQFDYWVNSGATFFVKLKKHEPLKWAKAVKEFLKGINAQGVEIT